MQTTRKVPSKSRKVSAPIWKKNNLSKKSWSKNISEKRPRTAFRCHLKEKSQLTSKENEEESAVVVQNNA